MTEDAKNYTWGVLKDCVVEAAKGVLVRTSPTATEEDLAIGLARLQAAVELLDAFEDTYLVTA